MNAILNKIRAVIFISADIANHMLWGVILFLAGSMVARLIDPGSYWAITLAGVLFAAGIAVLWEAINHRADPENPFDLRDIAAGTGGALLGALTRWLG